MKRRVKAFVGSVKPILNTNAVRSLFKHTCETRLETRRADLEQARCVARQNSDIGNDPEEDDQVGSQTS